MADLHDEVPSTVPHPCLHYDGGDALLMIKTIAEEEIAA